MFTTGETPFREHHFSPSMNTPRKSGFIISCSIIQHKYSVTHL